MAEGGQPPVQMVTVPQQTVQVQQQAVPLQVMQQQQLHQPQQQVVVVQVDPNGNPVPQIQDDRNPRNPTCCCDNCCKLNIAVLVLFIMVCIGAGVNILKWSYWDLGDFDEFGIIVNAVMASITLLLGLGYFLSITQCECSYSGVVCFGTFNVVYASIAMIVAFFFLICTCFSADTLVYLKKYSDTNEVHQATLRDIEVGDYVLTMDPYTNEIYWDEVLLRIHYNWYDNGNDYYYMRKLYLENNKTDLVLSNDHFIFINDENNEPKVIQTEKVQVGDMVYYYDYEMEMDTLVRVAEIEENVKSQKRVFFTMKPYLLVNNIVASPYIGPHPIYHTILHQILGQLLFLRYFGIQFLLSVVALIGYFGIYGSYFIVSYWMEFSIVVVSGYVVFFIVNKNQK